MEVSLSYGRTGLKVQVPEDRLAGILRLRPVPPLPNPPAAVADALRKPLGSPPLEEVARGRKNAIIVLCDVTRPVPNELLLRPLLETLHHAGLSRDAITLLIATGLHRPNEGAELEEMIGADLARDYRVVNHAGRDDASHADLGKTKRGTPVLIDKTYVEADLKILTGLVEPHLMAGYSGGRKVICPGLGSWRTVRILHSPSFLEQPACTAGRLADNPLHHELLEIAEMAGVDFIVNVTLDSDRRVTGVFAGEVNAAHLAGVARVEEIARVPIPAPADVVLTCGAGYPLDTTFYQAVKGMTGAMPAVKPGGTMVLAASMSEGIGGPEFSEKLLGGESMAQLMGDILASEEVAIDQWQIEEMGIVQRRAKVMCYSDGLDADTLRRCHVEPVANIEAAVAEALDAHGPHSRLYVLPEGPYVTPVVP